MKALIYEGKVVQIEEKEFPVARQLVWVECDNTDVATGWEYDSGSKVFSEPVIESMIPPM